MSIPSQICHVFHLINESLRPYTDLGVISVTNENEKEILVALSMILKQIQLCTHQINSSDNPPSTFEDNQLSEKVCGLIALLAVENQFVHHLVGSILLAIFEFAAPFERTWGELIHSLCIALEWAVYNISPDHPIPYGIKLNIINSDSLSFISKSKLKNLDRKTLAGIVRVLRNIIKFLKHGDLDHLLKVYLQCISSCLSSPCWEFFAIPADLRIVVHTTIDASDLMSIKQHESDILFLGNFLQFLCSLVEISDLAESGHVSQYRKLVLCDINKLVPKVLFWCLGKQCEWNNECISQYFRHKMLMIMIRLSSHLHLDCSRVTLWLQLLHKYFQDLLLMPLMQSHSCEDNCLEDSPFLLRFSDRDSTDMCLHHLQRQTVFLYLKCCLNLINTRERINGCCVDENLNKCLMNDLHCDYECSRKQGFLELYEWLRVHLSNEMFAGPEIFIEKCILFSLSFIQLFINEDDILFEALLLLHSLPPCSQQRIDRRNECFVEAKQDLLFVFWNLFNPVHLFHLFLSELCYDNLVLLDYLISKDTGITCVEYLLRCLRAVCDSWQSFVEFPGVNGEPLSKKSKVCVTKDKELRRREAFDDAKRCLLLLKECIVVDLEEQKSFPYDPTVFLRRLTRFEELCMAQESVDLK